MERIEKERQLRVARCLYGTTAHTQGSPGSTRIKKGARAAIKTNHVVYSPPENAVGTRARAFLKSALCLIGQSNLTGVKAKQSCFIEWRLLSVTLAIELQVQVRLLHIARVGFLEILGEDDVAIGLYKRRE